MFQGNIFFRNLFLVKRTPLSDSCYFRLLLVQIDLNGLVLDVQHTSVRGCRSAGSTAISYFNDMPVAFLPA